MPRRLLYVALAAVIGLVIYWIVRDDTKAASPDQAAGRTGTGAANPGAPPPAMARPGATPRARGDTPGPGDPGAPDGTRTYVTDTGNVVRDHRPDVKDPIAVPAPMPPGERTMKPEIAGDLYRQLAPIVRKCGVEAPAAGRGDNPVAHVTLRVDVTAGQLTTVDAMAVTSDITGPGADQVVACVRDRASGLTIPAAGEPDRAGYVLQYPIRLRK